MKENYLFPGRKRDICPSTFHSWSFWRLIKKLNISTLADNNAFSTQLDVQKRLTNCGSFEKHAGKWCGKSLSEQYSPINWHILNLNSEHLYLFVNSWEQLQTFDIFVSTEKNMFIFIRRYRYWLNIIMCVISCMPHGRKWILNSLLR